MEPDQPLTRAEARALLAYADVTYRSVTSVRRRIAAVAVGLAVLFGVLCAMSTVQWTANRARLAAVADADLIDTLGVQVPDPRPAIERGQLRVQILLWGFVAFATAAVTALCLALYAIVRPPALPPEITQLAAREPPDPPQDTLSRRGPQ